MHRTERHYSLDSYRDEQRYRIRLDPPARRPIDVDRIVAALAILCLILAGLLAGCGGGGGSDYQPPQVAAVPCATYSDKDPACSALKVSFLCSTNPNDTTCTRIPYPLPSCADYDPAKAIACIDPRMPGFRP